MPVRALALPFLVLALSASTLAAQHPVADRSIATSLLTAVPLPLSMAAHWADTARLERAFRIEVQHSRMVIGDVASPMLLVGFRSDDPGPDSTGWSAAITAFRLGFGAAPDGGAVPLAMEMHFGARTLGYLEHPGAPDAGFDVLLGWSGLERDDTDWSLALRVPAEWVVAAGRGRLMLAIAPAIAWGNIRIQRCQDDGPGDNCGDLGLQLEPGRTRFLLGGGIAYGPAPGGLALSLGAQRLMAAGQELRLSLGVAWSY